MNKILSIAVLAAGLSVGLAQQTIPQYASFTATGTTLAEIIIPAQPLQQIRVVGAVVTSDKAGSNLGFQTGNTPYVVGLSNNAGTTVTLTYTNGLSVNTNVIVSSSTTNASGKISSLSGTTNIVLAAAVFATVPGNEVYTLSGTNTLPVGATTISYQGEALFVGNKGRPLRVTCDGTSAVTINSLTVRYE